MFINFANVLNTSRKKPPFGIAQVGKSFRNEITPGNFVFRTREFEQMSWSSSSHRPIPSSGTSTGAPSGTGGTSIMGSPRTSSASAPTTTTS